MNNIILSLDWDHTLRKMHGLHMDLFILILFARAKKIPVGLTTHRDIENTTLYTVDAWQSDVEDVNYHALAAAISYWQTYLLTPLNIYFDFVNARYQPMHQADNYYEAILKPLEALLAHDIAENPKLLSHSEVEQKISLYTQQKEAGVANNQYKEAQIKWLHNYYDHHAPLSIIHLDDDPGVVQTLPLLAQMDEAFAAATIKTICVEDTALSSNATYVNLLQEIGLLDDAEQLMADSKVTHDVATTIAVCLFLAQKYYDDAEKLEYISNRLQSLEAHVTDVHQEIFAFAKALHGSIAAMKKPVYVIANDLAHLIFHH